MVAECGLTDVWVMPEGPDAADARGACPATGGRGRGAADGSSPRGCTSSSGATSAADDRAPQRSEERRSRVAGRCSGRGTRHGGPLSDRQVWPGLPEPLGATWDGEGTNFALFSEAAERVELCLFDDDGRETRGSALPRSRPTCWHGYVPGIAPGPALRLPGARPLRPRAGAALQPGQAPRSIPTPGRSTARSTGTTRSSATASATPDDLARRRATRRRACRSRVVVDAVVRLGRRPPAAHAVARDRHLRDPRPGLHHAPPRRARRAAGHLRAGSRTRPRIEHLTRLGVTAVELLPGAPLRVRRRASSSAGLRNYWGYNSIGFFAPHAALLVDGRQGRAGAASSRRWCKTLHAAGHRGDPRRRLQPHRRGQPPRPDAVASAASTTRPTTASTPTTRATTSTTPARGNSLNMRHPQVLQLIMDSLRYWVTEMHVDGFRFDLAAALARELHDVDRLSAVLRPHPPGPGRLRRSS